MKFLPVNVFRSGLMDCSADGVTLTHEDKLVVCCADGYLTREDVDERGYVIMDLHAARVKGYPCHFKPRGVKGHTMNGGNFIYSSDSRFGETFGRSPVAVHDRVEVNY